MNIFQRALMPLLSAVKAVTGWLFRKAGKVEDGFHVRRDGRVIYHGRNGVEKFRRWKRRQYGPTLPPKLTGARLARVSRSCSPYNLTVMPKHLDAGTQGVWRANYAIVNGLIPDLVEVA